MEKGMACSQFWLSYFPFPLSWTLKHPSYFQAPKKREFIPFLFLVSIIAPSGHPITMDGSGRAHGYILNLTSSFPFTAPTLYSSSHLLYRAILHQLPLPTIFLAFRLILAKKRRRMYTEVILIAYSFSLWGIVSFVFV